MIVMLDTSADLETAGCELGCEVEELLTPTTRRRRKTAGRFAIDNGAYVGFNAKTFLSLLERNDAGRRECRFVTAPDIVADARRTCEMFYWWYGRLARWPLALVCQDGQEHLEIPWHLIAAVFIGGSTQWKMSPAAKAIIQAAKAAGKWAHVGRVNTPGRFEYFDAAGADSIDGTGLSQYSWMRKAIYERQTSPKLFETGAYHTLEEKPELNSV